MLRVRHGPTTTGNGPLWHGSDTAHSPTRAGPAAERTVEFFTAQIRNPHTRAAYAAAVTRFFTWCDARGLALTQLSPIAVATYIEEMQSMYRAPTIKQHLAAIRRLFDWLGEHARL